jgi:hypothetical protein
MNGPAACQRAGLFFTGPFAARRYWFQILRKSSKLG